MVYAIYQNSLSLHLPPDELMQRTAGVLATTAHCNLRKGYSAAEIKPFDANSTYGCQPNTSTHVFEIHYFSSYKSASRDQTINVTLQTQDQKKNANIRLFVITRETVYWRLSADLPTTVGSLTWVS